MGAKDFLMGGMLSRWSASRKIDGSVTMQWVLNGTAGFEGDDAGLL